MRSERGSAAVELVLIAPALVMFLLLAVLAGRGAEARAEVDAAARDGARAASMARSATAAQAAGQAAAESSLTSRGVACKPLMVSVDTSGFAPGGLVTATVTCTIALSDLSRLGIPGSRTLAAHFAEPVDLYRGVSNP